MGRASRPRSRRAGTHEGRDHALSPRTRAAAGPASFPGARSPRKARWRSALLAVFAGAFGLLGATPAAAQSTLVGNTGQTAGASDIRVGHLNASNIFEHATAFTTGATTGGYAISGVDVRLGSSVPSGADPQVTIHDVTSGGDPNNLILTLTKPATLTAGAVNTFTADPGAKLGAQGTYAVVLRQAGSSGSWTIRRTSSDSEDSGAASGWSIADEGRENNTAGSSGWVSASGSSLMIAVKGWEDTAAPTVSSARVAGTKLTIVFNETLRAAANLANSAFTVKRTPPGGTATNVSLSTTAPAVSGSTVVLTLASAVSIADTVTVSYTQPTTGTDNQIRDTAGNAAAGFTDQSAAHALVSNWRNNIALGALIVGQNGMENWEHAGYFTTGPGSAGYTLSSVDLSLPNVPDATATPQVSIHSVTSSGTPDSSLHALSNPASFKVGSNTFTAAAGATLDANTTYAVVLQSSGTGNWDSRHTNVDNEDLESAHGWSIGNQRHANDAAGTDGWTAHTSVPFLRVWGAAADTTAPAVAAAWVKDDKLTIVFDEVLGAATLANDAFAVKKIPAGGTETTAGLSTEDMEGPSISGATVVLTLASAVASTDGGFKVSYTKPTTGTGNRIVNAVDIEAETFADQAVTNSLPLVANTGQGISDNVTVGVTGSNNFQHANAFTTGPSTGGYTLAEVDVNLSLVSSNAPRASIYSTDSSGNPDSSLHTLIQLGSNKVGVNTFAAPAGATLTADTTYAVVVEETGSALWQARVTASDGEDAGGAHGWSIADRHVFQDAAGSDGWGNSTVTHSLMVAVRGAPVDTTGPTFASALVNGDKVTITYNEALGSASLDNDDFTVKKTASDGSESTVALHGTTGPSVSGSTVVLTLASAVGNTDFGFKVSYAKPTTAANRIVNAADIEADSFSDEIASRVMVTNLGQATGSSTSTATHDIDQSFTTGSNSGGYGLTSVDFHLHFQGRPSSTLRVRILEGSHTGTEVAALGAGSLLTLNPLVYRFAARQGTTLAASTTYAVVFDTGSVNVITTTSGSEDTTGASGWAIADTSQWRSTGSSGSAQAMKMRVNGDAITAPTVSTVAITSTPSHDADNDNSPDTYGLGDTIEVQVTFSKAVTVTGTPRLKIKMDPMFGEKWAEYDRGSGFTVLTFAYEVVSPNISTQGIAVLENTLELNGGTIKDANDSSVDATLTHIGLAHDADHKVDHQLTETRSPVFASTAVNGSTLTLTFDEALDTTSVPAPGDFHVTVGGTRRHVASGGVAINGATVTLTLTSAVALGDTVTVGYTPGTNPLRDAAGNAVASLAGTTSVANDTGTSILVSNTGQAEGSSGNASFDHAQAFTTGSSGEGYKLTGIGVFFFVSGVNTGWEVELWSDSGTASGTKLNTLNKPASVIDGVNWFTATGAGIDLAADTTYWLVWDNPTSADASKMAIGNTTSDDEDAGGAAAWSIANTSGYRSNGSTGGWTEWADSRRISMRGYAVEDAAQPPPDTSSPVVSSASANGSTLTITFNENLVTTSVPATSAFTVTVVGSSNPPTVTSVNVSGRTVTLGLDSAVQPGETVQVGYTPPGMNPLRDTAGNPVAAFGNRPVTTRPPGGGGGTPRPEPEPVNHAPETAGEPIGEVMLREEDALEVDLSEHFSDPDDDALEYAAESSDPAVATVEVDGDTLTVRALARGMAEITVTATDPDDESAMQKFEVTVTGPELVWYVPPMADPARQGFVRVLNHSDASGAATVTATDDAGVEYEPLTLALGPRQAASFNSDDLESGNADKGLGGATGPGTGGWRLAIESDDLEVEALAYMRTADGFLTGMNAIVPGEDGLLEIPTFNPGSNVDQVSLLRLVNPTGAEAEATVTGVDDAGMSPGAPVLLTLPAESACTVDAAQLESGAGLACGEPQNGLGDGAGKWRLTVASDAALVAMSLLSSPAGHLTNLSGSAAEDEDGVWHVDLLPAASDPLGRQGFVRVTNRSNVDGRVRILAYDDSNVRYDALGLDLGAGESRHFNSDDLELGNRAKGLTGSTGSGRGNWRLRVYSGLDIDANAYVRTTDGFLTAMQARAPRAGDTHRVTFFNPGSNENQVSVLRLVNQSPRDAEVSIDGTDDLGLRPGGTVQVLVPATDAVELTAAELESGEADAIVSGALGDGTGKWRLRIESNRIAAVLSLLSSPAGHLTNLSHADGERELGPLPVALLPPPERVTLESPDRRELRARWSAVEGARYDVELLRNGVADEDRSLNRARNTTLTFRWTHLLPGTYTVRARSVNEERRAGPWRAAAEEVVID